MGEWRKEWNGGWDVMDEGLLSVGDLSRQQVPFYGFLRNPALTAGS
ncbi:hypothetical protein WMO41_15585 [Ventrimonas sp. CLA-AP-H27]|uniref:Uncharacterized protein n=1 Tax=Ventrimonas faecis TaxID=3133170 RepID=A0ABV1HR35_9FIRM